MTVVLRLLLLVAMVLAGQGLPAPAQQSSPAADVPDYVLYDSLFFRVTWLEDLANRLAAEGKADMAIRTAIRRELGLTPQEESALREIARAWRAQNDTILNSARAEVAAGGAAAADSVQGLMQRRKETVRDHVEQLRASLGAARFPAIDAAVRRNSAIRPPAASRAEAASRPRGGAQ